MTLTSFLARTVPIAALLIALGIFGNTGGMVALAVIIVGMVVWAAVHGTPEPIVEYDFAD